MYTFCHNTSPCAGNVGCSPLPCMLMRALFVHTAHEIAGAARIRHSLRPLNFGGGKLLANLGRIAPREGETVSTVIARSACDEAIHASASRKNGLLRIARNDGGA